MVKIDLQRIAFHCVIVKSHRKRIIAKYVLTKIKFLYHINRDSIITIIVILVTAFLLLFIISAFADTEVSLQGQSLTAQTDTATDEPSLPWAISHTYPMWMPKQIHKDQDIAKVLNCNVLLRRDLNNIFFLSNIKQ